jgi:hypothetical protein
MPSAVIHERNKLRDILDGIDSLVSGIKFGDSQSLDGFGNARVSETRQRLDVEFLYTKQHDFFDEITNNGTVTLNSDPRDITLSLSSAADGDHATMRSHPVPYTPGNSQLIEGTATLDNADIGTGTAQVFLRSNVTGSVVETVIDQSSWTAATSGVDWATSQIFRIDFQSLKVGRIRFALIRGGVPVQVATIENDNAVATGYWQMASLQVCFRLYCDDTYTYAEFAYGDANNAVGFRYRLSATTSATMRAICCTVKSEGGQNLRDMHGLPRSADNGVASVTASTSLVPILSIRPRSTFQSRPNLSIALPKAIEIATDNPVRIALLHNAVLTDPVWTDVDTDESAVEYDVSATAVSNGHRVYSTYVATARNKPATGQGLLGKTVLWDRQGSETGILTVAGVRTGITDAEVFASLQWEEIL